MYIGNAKDIVKHEEKIFHIIHILLLSYLVDARYERFLDAIEHDKHEKDRSRHIVLETFKRIYEVWKYSDDQKETADNHLGLFKDTHK